MAESFGTIDQRPNGRYRARYTAPDPHGTSGLTPAQRRISAPGTFATKAEARSWLSRQHASIADGSWVHPDESAKLAETEAARAAVTFGTYADRWVRERTNSRGEPIRPRTRKEYERMLTSENGFLAEWRTTPLTTITPDAVRSWRTEKLATGALTATARAYDLMKSILKTAVEDGLITINPCQIKGGSLTSTKRKVRPPTDDELEALIAAIDKRYKALVVVAAAGGLRYGECLALTTNDVIVDHTEDGEVDCVRLVVDDAVVEGSGIPRESGQVKSEASVRGISIFGRDARIIADHVAGLPAGALLWTDTQGRYISQSSVNNSWWSAREEVGCTDVTFHSLRHYQGTRYAQTGATLAEIMARLGHSSARAAMRYQHSGVRDDELARRAARD
ncbi:tyrosine-type recombinase/integrase [Gordonia sp. 852002-10350_SCH5691597]|uniref:tyrosine-type recombinase/integrase n=1 Tax=Gordonia sp. 852002-10350_SCH5691597 TaxID=1834085 RepID=UPI0007EA27CA|nr:tyrosine-type recombinase/integrase [Gordonia sp. 852002-10350_SCH5691597]OBA67746.1 integrase [Gordonia sp. 852002-10350_SCH5691597]